MDAWSRAFVVTLRQRGALVLAAALLLAGCGGGGGTTAAATAAPPAPPAAPAAPPAFTPVNADIAILMIGNSHTAFHALPQTLAALVRAGRPGRSVGVAVAPDWMFLDAHLANATTMALLTSQRWSFVILQAQKYSSSGLFTYSTAEAEALVRQARTQGAVPVLFPEWPRRGVDETQRIYDVHVSIARREPACVAPIGQAWDRALARHPGLVLHDADGNHSAPPGAFLAALVLSAALTGAAPDGLPDLALATVPSATQQQLRAVAAETVAAIPPRTWCPNDPY